MEHSAARRASMILGGVMIAAIALSAILPIFQNNATNTLATIEATTVPTVTPPPVLTDFTTISFDNDYLHPSGLFSVATPTGWIPGQETSKPEGVEITMNNGTLLSVIQTSVQISPTVVADLDEVDAIYNSASLNSSWANYARYAETGLNYRETSRTRDGDKLTIDFELKNTRGQIFVARQVAWWDTDWIYSIRVVTPDNQIELLKFLMDHVVTSFKPNRIFAGTPGDWRAFFDPSNNLVVRYPSNWSITDTAIGRPTTINGANEVLRVQSQSVSAPLDEAAAGTWVTTNVAGATVTSTEPITRGTLAGFSVAYTYTDTDGNPNSGVALLINGENNTVYSANLRIFEANVDLNDDTAQASHSELVKVLGTFQLLSGVNVPLPTPTPTLTLPPPSATSEFTATPEATETPLPTNTAEPTNTTEPTNTDVPATNTPKPTNTAVPPTATDVPPSSTPRPTATPRPPTATTEPTEEATAESTPA